MKTLRFLAMFIMLFLPSFLSAGFLDDLGADAKLDFWYEAFSVNWSPDGKYLSIGGYDFTVQFVGKVAVCGWNSATNKLEDLVDAKKDFGLEAYSVNWSQDGKYIAVGGDCLLGESVYSGTVAVYGWNSATKSLDDLGDGAKKNFGTLVYSVNWSPDGKYLAACGFDDSTDPQIGTVAVYEWNSITNSLDDLESLAFWTEVKSVNWSPDGKYLAVGGDNNSIGKVAVYEWSGSVLIELNTQDFGINVNSVNWSQDGKYLAVGGGISHFVGNVAVYGWNSATKSLDDLGSGAQLAFGRELYSVNWSPDGKYLSIGGYLGTTGKVAVYQWDSITNSFVDLGVGAKLDFGTSANSVNWSLDSKYLAIGGYLSDAGDKGKVAVYLTYNEYLMSLISHNSTNISAITGSGVNAN